MRAPCWSGRGATSRARFFFPDQNLGRNTAVAMGVPLEHMADWEWRAHDLERANARCLRPETRIVLWRGWCSVHTKFTLAQVQQARAEDPAVRVLVHPECSFDVVQHADLVGSTEFIIDQVRRALPARAGRSAPRSTWSTACSSSIRSSGCARSRPTCARVPP